jgi:hypothetical protein
MCCVKKDCIAWDKEYNIIAVHLVLASVMEQFVTLNRSMPRSTVISLTDREQLLSQNTKFNNTNPCFV